MSPDILRASASCCFGDAFRVGGATLGG